MCMDSIIPPEIWVECIIHEVKRLLDSSTLTQRRMCSRRMMNSYYENQTSVYPYHLGSILHIVPRRFQYHRQVQQRYRYPLKYHPRHRNQSRLLFDRYSNKLAFVEYGTHAFPNLHRHKLENPRTEVITLHEHNKL
jgi:hypothetical protein